MAVTSLLVDAGGWQMLRELNNQVPRTLARYSRNLAQGNKGTLDCILWQAKVTNSLFPLIRVGLEIGPGYVCY